MGTKLLSVAQQNHEIPLFVVYCNPLPTFWEKIYTTRSLSCFRYTKIQSKQNLIRPYVLTQYVDNIALALYTFAEVRESWPNECLHTNCIKSLNEKYPLFHDAKHKH